MRRGCELSRLLDVFSIISMVGKPCHQLLAETYDQPGSETMWNGVPAGLSAGSAPYVVDRPQHSACRGLCLQHLSLFVLTIFLA